jgi:hypothetical protein
MGAVTPGRARATVTGFAETVACFLEGSVAPMRRIADLETARAHRDVEGRPVKKNARWRVGILDHQDKAPCSLRYPERASGGERSAPSQVYCGGIGAPGRIARLVSISGNVVTALPEGHSMDTDRRARLPQGDRK